MKAIVFFIVAIDRKHPIIEQVVDLMSCECDNICY